MEARTLRQLIDDCREELDDEVAPYLYDDAALIRHLNDGVLEACLRARLLVETSRADICQIALEPGRAAYTLHSSIFVIRRVELDGQDGSPLARVTSATLDRRCRRWRSEKGVPRYLVRDMQSRQVLVSPVPEEPTVLRLTVWRGPAADEMLENDDDEPVIDVVHHAKLIHWACHRAFLRKDSERYDPASSASQLELFEQYFGTRPTARSLQNLAIDQVSGTEEVWF